MSSRLSRRQLQHSDEIDRLLNALYELDADDTGVIVATGMSPPPISKQGGGIQVSMEVGGGEDKGEDEVQPKPKLGFLDRLFYSVGNMFGVDPQKGAGDVAFAAAAKEAGGKIAPIVGAAVAGVLGVGGIVVAGGVALAGAGIATVVQRRKLKKALAQFREECDEEHRVARQKCEKEKEEIRERCQNLLRELASLKLKQGRVRRR